MPQLGHDSPLGLDNGSCPSGSVGRWLLAGLDMAVLIGRSELLDDIVGVAKVGESRITNAYKTLNEKLGLPAKPATPTMYIPRLASDIDFPEQIRRRARALAEAAEDARVTTGVRPAGFAAASLYRAGQEAGRWLTQTEIAEVANTSTGTVRNHRDTVQEQVV